MDNFLTIELQLFFEIGNKTELCKNMTLYDHLDAILKKL